MSYRARVAVLSITAIVSCQVMPVAKAQAQPAAAVVACASNPACLSVVVIGGIAYFVLSNGQYVPYRGTGGYLEDLEGSSEEWSDYIWADSLQQAQSRCQYYAINKGVVLVKVVQRGRNNYECRFRTYRT